MSSRLEIERIGDWRLRGLGLEIGPRQDNWYGNNNAQTNQPSTNQINQTNNMGNSHNNNSNNSNNNINNKDIPKPFNVIAVSPILVDRKPIIQRPVQDEEKTTSSSSTPPSTIATTPPTTTKTITTTTTTTYDINLFILGGISLFKSHLKLAYSAPLRTRLATEYMLLPFTLHIKALEPFQKVNISCCNPHPSNPLQGCFWLMLNE